MTIETIADRCRELATLITRHTSGKADGLHPTEIDQLDFARESSVATSLHGVVEPMLAIVVQGKKAALLGEETYYYGAAQCSRPRQFKRSIKSYATVSTSDEDSFSSLTRYLLNCPVGHISISLNL